MFLVRDALSVCADGRLMMAEAAGKGPWRRVPQALI